MSSESCKTKGELLLAYHHMTLVYAEALLDMQRRRLRLSATEYAVLSASIELLGQNARKARFCFEIHISDHGC
jgi:hypothetical protein